jgi:class 3 adenylate cyclase
VGADTDWLIISPGTDAERAVPVPERLFVGRECAGIDASRRLIIDRPKVSRDHFELRADPLVGTTLIDLSTNGTWVNGRRVERGEPLALSDGDRIEVGDIELEFRAPSEARAALDPSLTIVTPNVTRLAVAVGDVVGYTAMTERHGAEPVAGVMETLFGSLQKLLQTRRGTVGNYVGDALFAAWDVRRDPQATASAVAFALDAAELVTSGAFATELGGIGAVSLRMGWAVTVGDAVSGRPTRASESIHGDALNLAFRLASVAGRDGRPPVLVTPEVVAGAPKAADYEPLGELSVRGRSSGAIAFAAGRTSADGG